MNSIRTIRRSLSGRLRDVRIDRFGEADPGLECIGLALGMPADNWRIYEESVVMPAEVLLKLIELTRVNARSLLTGKGPRCSRTDLNARFLSANQGGFARGRHHGRHVGP